MMSSRYVWTLASLAAVGVLAFGYGRRAQGPAKEEREVAAVRAVLEAQQAAWNRGDIESFMDGYAREEAITFLSGGTLTRGWQTVFDRYKSRYDSPAKMGKLTFSELEFKPLSEFYMMATGRWQLAREADAPRGRFTLIFRRTTGGWRIVHDHTSTE
jgi:beta-aspartyl-peptidase (threonine type)